jgi:hypothetical protein
MTSKGCDMTGSSLGRDGADIPEPRRIRQLRHLVTTLTAVLIVGVITVVALLVIRLSTLTPAAAPALPATLALPAGETARAVTLGAGWVAVVTEDARATERIRVFDAATGAERAVTEITPAPAP